MNEYKKGEFKEESAPYDTWFKKVANGYDYLEGLLGAVGPHSGIEGRQIIEVFLEDFLEEIRNTPI